MTIENVLEFAVGAHKGQLRKCGVLPYVVHPIEVMKKVAQWGVTDETILAAALLHDVLEDCPDVTQSMLTQLFGWDVSKIVGELTFHSGKYRNKEAYLLSFDQKSYQAVLIKVADRICNVNDFLVSKEYDYAKRYFLKGSSVYQALNEFRWESTPREVGRAEDELRDLCVKVDVPLVI